MGIKVTIIEPGPFRTSFGEKTEHSVVRIADYEATVHAKRERYRNDPRSWSGDLDAAVAAVIAVAGEAEPPLRLALGDMSMRAVRAKCRAVLEESERWETLSLSGEPATCD